VLDCKGSGQEKWSSGLREALPTDHNGDVPNGYALRARTPLRRWCNRIPILAIPILAMSRGNVVTGLTFSRHSSGVSGSSLVICEWLLGSFILNRKLV
jgi:hypothetical protein